MEKIQMTKEEWMDQLENPRGIYDRDGIALRHAVKYILSKIEACNSNSVNESVSAPSDSAEFREVLDSPKRRGRPRKEEPNSELN